jgi:hypothetical protein
VFGDERADYGAALRSYYSGAVEEWDERRFVARYGQSHPHEDWAETFAHYLHLVDLVDTAGAHGLIDVGPAPDDALPVPARASLPAILDLWRPISRAVDDIADTLGSPHQYPFGPDGPVVDKLAYVHARVTARSPRHDPPTR